MHNKETMVLQNIAELTAQVQVFYGKPFYYLSCKIDILHIYIIYDTLFKI